MSSVLKVNRIQLGQNSDDSLNWFLQNSLDTELPGSGNLDIFLGADSTEPLASITPTGELRLLNSLVYAQSNVVGTVGQVGGIPDGALVEYGSNANGEYWRYAGGMQICTLRSGKVATYFNVGTLIAYWTFPASFVESPHVNFITATLPPSGKRNIWWRPGALSPNNCQLSVMSSDSMWTAGDESTVYPFAIGRWYI